MIKQKQGLTQAQLDNEVITVTWITKSRGLMSITDKVSNLRPIMEELKRKSPMDYETITITPHCT